MRARFVVTVITLSVLASCGAGAGVQIGESRIALSDMESILEAVQDNPAYISWHEQKTQTVIVGPDARLRGDYIATVVSNEITNLVISEEAVRRKITPSNQDRIDGANEASGAVGGRRVLDAFPAPMASELKRRAATGVAFRKMLIRGVTPKKYYDGHRDEFVKPCTHDIVVPTRAAAEKARDRIKSGEPFGSVAQDVSIDEGTASKGGDLGCNGRDDLVPELNRAALTLPLGKVSQPIERHEGYHVFMVTSRKIPPFEKVKGEAAAGVVRLSQERLADIVRKRLTGEDVAVHPRFGRWDAQRLVVLPA